MENKEVKGVFLTLFLTAFTVTSSGGISIYITEG